MAQEAGGGEGVGLMALPGTPWEDSVGSGVGRCGGSIGRGLESPLAAHPPQEPPLPLQFLAMNS